MSTYRPKPFFLVEVDDIVVLLVLQQVIQLKSPPIKALGGIQYPGYFLKVAVTCTKWLSLRGWPEAYLQMKKGGSVEPPSL